MEAEHGRGAVPILSQATAYRRLDELAKGKYALGGGKARRSVANRPYGRLRAARRGEYVVLDTTPLDVFAMEPVMLRWVPVELTVAMDLYSRCVLGLRLTPISTKSADVANVLYQCVSPTDMATAAMAPFHGIPWNVLVKHEDPQTLTVWKVGDRPACLPEAVVYDRGPQYMSAHVLGVCARLGITVLVRCPRMPPGTNGSIGRPALNRVRGYPRFAASFPLWGRITCTNPRCQ